MLLSFVQFLDIKAERSQNQVNSDAAVLTIRPNFLLLGAKMGSQAVKKRLSTANRQAQHCRTHQSPVPSGSLGKS
jgi:hypothetical protein